MKNKVECGDCIICRWGPDSIKCPLGHCRFDLINNAEGLRRLDDEQMEEWLGLSQLWLKKEIDTGLKNLLLGIKEEEENFDEC